MYYKQRHRHELETLDTLYTIGNFTFWISLSLSLKTHSKIRTESKVKPKCEVDYFVQT